MRVFVVNSAGRSELPAESGKHSLSLYSNRLEIDTTDKSQIHVESTYETCVIDAPGNYEIPIVWDTVNKCNIVLKSGGSVIKYQFQLEGVVVPSEDNIENLLKFASQLEDYFMLEKEYSIEDLFEAIRTDKVALIIEKTPYLGYDDQSLLKKISETVPMVMDICSHPKQSLRSEEAVLDVNLVKRINSRTMDHLSSHSEHWKARTLNGLIPNRLRADIFEDEINIYENLFFRMAVDDILKYVHRQAVSIEKTIEQNDNAIDWNAYGEALYDYKRMRIFEQLLPDYDLQERQNENSILRSLFEQWLKLEKNFSTVEASQFFRSIDKKKHISRNIKPTNILKKDSRYNALYRLWCEIQRQIVQEHNESQNISGGEAIPLNNCYSMYVISLLLYAFRLLECTMSSDSKFKISVDGRMSVNAVFDADHLKYRITTEDGEYGNQNIKIEFIEKVSYEYHIPKEVVPYVEDIHKKLPGGVEFQKVESKLIFYSKPTEVEQRELKNIFHLSNSEKKSMGEAEKRSKDLADKAWRPELEELFASGKIRDAKVESILITPQFSVLDSSESAIEKYTQILLEATKGNRVYMFPAELGEYRKSVKSDRILYRLLNYGEKYHEDDAEKWGDYRIGMVPVAQSEINSAQRIMKLISLHSSRLQIKWGGKNVVCPICGNRDCRQNGIDSWICNGSDCGVIFGKTKHADGCGQSYEWTRPQVDVKEKDVVFGDTLNLMLRKEIIFDRLTITDFEFEKQMDGKIRYIPVCPKCGKRNT